MKRRNFLAASCLAGLAGLARTAASAKEPQDSSKQFLELRCYHFTNKEQRARFVKFVGDVAIPALNRIGIKPVGVFQYLEGDNLDLYGLLPHKSPETVLALGKRLYPDPIFCRDGKALLETPKSDPAYTRFESSLLYAFDAVPKVEIPAKGDARVFQLRIYESHSIIKGQRKIEMFNSGGEVDVFRRCGMNPVFFGEALIGDKLPNLTYMLGFDTPDDLKDAWKKFLAHPDWEKLKTDPYYAETVSNITNIMLVPAACSQI